MDEPDEILGAVFRRVVKDLDRAREASVMDDDWLDTLEERLRDLFRDLAVLAGLAERAVDWEGDGQPDPLDSFDGGSNGRMSRRELRQSLLDLDLRTDCDPEGDLCMVDDPDDALERADRALRRLPRLVKDDEDLDALQGGFEELLDFES